MTEVPPRIAPDGTPDGTPDANRLSTAAQEAAGVVGPDAALAADAQGGDGQGGDGQGGDGQSANGQSANGQSADRQSADRQSADRQSADRQSADRQAAAGPEAGDAGAQVQAARDQVAAAAATPAATAAPDGPPASPGRAAARPDPILRSGASDWQRTLWVMMGIQLIMTLSFTVLSPILPLFLPQIGVHSPAAIDLWTGVLNGVTAFVAAFASPLWGRLSDRKGRKLMLLRSGIAISIFTALMGLSQTVWQFFAFRALMGAFAGFSASAITLVASQVPEERLGFALGWLSTGQLVGGLAGPIVGGLVADISGSYRIPFFVTSCLTGTAAALAWLLVHEQFDPPQGRQRRQSTFAALRMVAAAGGLLPLFLVLLFAQFGVRTVQPVVTLYVQQLIGNVPNLATLGGLAFSVTGMGDVIASPFLGKRSDVLGYRRVLLICLFGAALFSVPQAFTHSYWGFVGERFGVGMFIGGILPTANALVGRLAPPEHRGTVFGLTASATFLGNSLGPLTGGTVAASFGLRWVFLVTAGVLIVNLVWVAIAVPGSVDRRPA